MIDFIKLVIYPSKEVCVEYVQIDRYGYYYQFPYEKVYIRIDKENPRVEIRFSPMYCMQGHNVSFDRQVFIDSINLLSEALQIDLWQASVEILEFGVVMEVPQRPAEYIIRHHAKAEERLIENEKKNDKGCFRYWEDKDVSLKMYDVGKNLKNKVAKSIRNQIAGYNADLHYIKFEIHYKRPHRVLNNGHEILLTDLLTAQWESLLKEDLYIQYQRLYFTGGLLPPQSVKEISSIDLLLRKHISDGIAAGKSIAELKKEVYESFKYCSILSPEKRKSRQCQYRKAEKKLKLDKVGYDLTDYINSVLQQ